MQDPTAETQAPLTAQDRARFAAIVGERYALSNAEDIAGYLIERRGLYRGATPLVLMPRSTDEVSRIMALASELKRPVVPQGGNTGLVGGQIPFEHGGDIVLNLSRLNAIRSVDVAANVLVAEAGVTLGRIQEEAQSHDRLFPLSLTSEGTCQIGGNLSTNAGGMQVLSYGNARNLCLGLEVVLADGRVWDGLRALRKDNTGYDLRDLFIGAEGTLGIITAAVLTLVPNPMERATAFVGLENLDRVAEFFETAHGALGRALTRFELFPRFGLDLVLKHAEKTRDPLSAACPWYVILEISEQHQVGRAEAQLMHILEASTARDLLRDAVVATSTSQERAFWAIREHLSDVQKEEGGSIKNDIAVPVSQIPAFIRQANERVASVLAGVRPIPFGHYGDGNIHYNISQPVEMHTEDFIAYWDELCGVVNEVALGLGGSISAEHGIGRLKRHLMPEIKSDVELEMMKQIKASFDPLNILNPGKIL